MQRRAAAWEPLALCLDGAKMCAADYVDNLYSIGMNAKRAVEIQEQWAEDLRSRWGVLIKDTSRQLLLPAGSTDQSPNQDRWPTQREMDVLGHRIASNCSTAPCWERSRKLAWICSPLGATLRDTS